MKKKTQFTKVMQYVGWVGDASFIKTGKRPVCSQCASKRLEPLVEVVQHGFAGDKVSLVMRCGQCMNTTIFDYELVPATQDELIVMVNEQIDSL